MPTANSAKSHYWRTSGVSTDIPQMAASSTDRVSHSCCSDKPQLSRQGPDEV